MSLPTFSSDFIDTTLYQLGATTIKVVNGKQHVVDFVLDEDIKITYLFTVTRENRYYLQRAEPYPMVHGRFSDWREIIDFIAKDIKAFQWVVECGQYPQCVENVRCALSLAEDVEKIFLQHHLEPEDLEDLQVLCGQLRQRIKTVYDKTAGPDKK